MGLGALAMTKDADELCRLIAIAARNEFMIQFRETRAPCKLKSNTSYRNDIQNGVFDQFFYNASGQFFDETRKALEETGATVMLSLLERACTVFPGGIVPKDQLERRTLLCALSADAEKFLSGLDDEFNAKTSSNQVETNSPENPWFLALQYMRGHANDWVASDLGVD